MRQFVLFSLPLVLAVSACAQIGKDVSVFADQASQTTTVSSPAFSTTAGNELLLAFIATDYLSGANTTVKAVAGAGLTWTLVARTNAQKGTAEIWRAFAVTPLNGVSVTATLSQSVASTMTVISFTGTDTSGLNGSGAIGATANGSASSGAPVARLTTTRNGSWIFGVGNDYDNAIPRSPGPAQTVVHQYLSPAGDTYWVQMQTNPTASSGTQLAINDTAPTSDQYNLSLCEILPASSGIPETYTISGSITPLSAGNATALTLGGSGAGTVSADSSGNYSFTGLANGNYTITPAKSGYVFTPPSQNATVNGANVTGINFNAQSSGGNPAVLGMDARVSFDRNAQSATVTSPAFSTATGNDLLLAFIATDYLSGANTTVKSVTGAGLTWALAVRTNSQSGTSEIWRALAPSPLSNVTVTATLSQSVASSITVISFTGVDTSGTNGSSAIGAIASGSAGSGAPSTSLTTTRNGSWIFGVGNDYDNAITRTAAAGQTVLHQYLSSAGDTYWVQMQNSPTALSGTRVGIFDTAPTSDRYNLSIVEVLPSLSGGGGGGTPPTVTMTAPAPNGIATGRTTVTAQAASSNYPVVAVQFLLDGANLGTEVTSAPYSMTWDTTTVNPGTHTLAAIARNSAGLSTTSSGITVTVDNSGSPAIVGSWSAPIQTPAVAVNLILLPNNKLLFYQDGASPTVWDYLNNGFSSIATTQDVFCSGHSALADGRILVVGGYGGNPIGLATAEIFDPLTNTWTSVPSMSYRRWYPTATTLSDGRILVTAGWQTTEHSNAGIPEIYDPATNAWTKLTKADNPFETYPFIFQLSDGRVIHVGGSEYATVTDILDLNTQTWSVVDPTIYEGGSAKMYLPDKIMKAGSAADSQMTGPSANTTFVLDMTQPSPAWKQTPSMAYPRSFLNLTSLPDGTVLVTGGETDKNGGDISKAVYPAELWSPQTQTWTTMSAMRTPREYHSTALLLPDGRVLVSGMGADFGNVPNETSGEFFSPPYLFKGARPAVTQSPGKILYGSNFFVATPNAASISKVVLIRTGAVTHAFDQNTRYVPLTFQQGAGGLNVTAPANGNLAPPGHYMLFVVNNAGVPSVAPIIQVAAQ
ncbi:MAG TPA: galactose oxidase-like domain-containing protein [Bryobacteraceae bacterium]